MTTAIARDDLVRFLRSTGHEPRIERVSAPADAAAAPRLHSPGE
jgi:Ala-tRNA(Pro) deacylase